MNDQQIQSVMTKRIFFGHQSVGDNILQGIRDLMASDPRLKINLVSSTEPRSIPGFAFIEAHVGVNRNPKSKTEAFTEVIDKGFGAEGGIAFYKYCYIDFGPKTDVEQVFADYREATLALKEKYPSLVLLHSTVPLTAEDRAQSAKEAIKNQLRRILGREPNTKRNRFNELLKQEYQGKDPVFDLAEVESTRSDASRSYFLYGFKKIYTLAPEYTTDGGHLNGLGRRKAAEQLLSLLATIPYNVTRARVYTEASISK